MDKKLLDECNNCHKIYHLKDLGIYYCDDDKKYIYLCKECQELIPTS